MSNNQDNPNAGNFIRKRISQDLAEGKYDRVQTRWPPEPNGYIHIGHAKAISINFGLAKEFGGTCFLRFDDTNPVKEEQEFVDAIQRDIRWLGYEWQELRFASGYFEQLYDWALELIQKGKAYVDSQSVEEIRENRGTLQQAGTESPYRERSVEENLDLFTRMRAGEFAEGTHVLRAKIDMSSGNMNFRDPIMYRILHETHQHTGDAWCIYPTYDWAHGQSDAYEGVTHSLCSLEFSHHKPLYEWYLDALEIPKPRSEQFEFAKLYLTHTIVAKRKLRQMVEEGIVASWDDPRMPTIAGMRRRGYPAKAIRDLCDRVGVDRNNAMTEFSLLEFFVRQELNASTQRVMAVLDPIKVTISNYPEDKVEWLTAINNPEDEAAGTRQLPFSKTLYIERADFMEDAPKKFFRLTVGKEVRFMNAYVIRCDEVIKDAEGNVTELVCSYDPETLGKNPPDRRVRGVVHWLSAQHAVAAEVRLYDRLFTVENPNKLPEGTTFTDVLNPDSLQVVEAWLEPSLRAAPSGEKFQFVRNGYYVIDEDSTTDKQVFNRIVGLKDSWSKKH